MALILVAGILTLLVVVSLAMAGLSLRLREHMAAGIDGAAARLLARSGIEYGAARLSQDNGSPRQKTPGNQPDDWTFRDDPETPLEKALNPSYAQTEPYADLYPLANPASSPGSGETAGNGRYDAGQDTFTDLDGDNRFSAYSGRLRGLYGTNSQTFALKISAEGPEGGINVNAGYLEPTMEWGSPGVPDFRDLESARFAGISEVSAGQLPPEIAAFTAANPQVAPGVSTDAPRPELDRVSRNRRVAFTINQLGELLGIATPRPGSLIILNRPLGGYRDVEQAARFFPPADWERLKPHLTVHSRLNRSYFYDFQDTGVPGVRYDMIPDRRYLLGALAASTETIAACFSGIGHGFSFPGLNEEVPAFNIILPPEALRLAGFLKRRPFESRYDLYRKLLENRSDLFFLTPSLPPSPFPYGPDPVAKVQVAHALALTKEWEGYHFTNTQEVDYASWGAYDLETSPLMYSSRLSKSVAFGGSNSGGTFRLGTYNMEMKARGSADLAFGPAALMSTESLGRVSDIRGIRSLRRASGLLGEEALVSESQRDFENLGFDPATRQSGLPRRFDGGLILGRPSRDRATTYPSFSREVCEDCLSTPPSFNPFETPSPIPPGGTLALFDYPSAYGEVMLSDRSWVDTGDQASFYVPFWDSHQPDWPGPSPTDRTSRGIFQDVVGGKKASGLSSNSSYYWQWPILCSGYFQRGASFTPLQFEAGSGLYEWVAESPPWVDPLVGRVDQGTIEWQNRRLPKAGQGDNRGLLRLMLTANSDYWRVDFGFSGWSQLDGGYSVSDLSNPGTPSTEGRDLVAFTFLPDDGSPDTYHHKGVNQYVNGVWVAGGDYHPSAWNPATNSEMRWADGYINDKDELRLYRQGLSESKILAQAMRGRFWTPAPEYSWAGARDLGAVPSFTSPLYRFDSVSRLGWIHWDGFVPQALGKAAQAAAEDGPAGTVPLRVDLLLYPDPDGKGTPIEAPLPMDAWKTGGSGIDFDAAWGKCHSTAGVQAPKVFSLRYRVWLDASAMERPIKTPVFDAIEIHYRNRTTSRPGSFKEW